MTSFAATCVGARSITSRELTVFAPSGAPSPTQINTDLHTTKADQSCAGPVKGVRRQQ
jgi:hypothetical protein